MSDTNRERALTNQERVEQHAADLLAWFDSWHAAWLWCMNQGMADEIFGAEYRRTTGEALQDDVPNCQTSMRQYIRLAANAPSTESITQASLKRREIRRLQHPEDN